MSFSAFSPAFALSLSLLSPNNKPYSPSYLLETETPPIFRDNEYAELRPNRTLCALYAEAMSLPSINSPVTCDFRDTDPFPGSTDQGNVSYVVPSFHGGYAIPCAPDAFNHTPAFTQAAGSEDAYLRTVDTSKGMALAGWRVLSEKDVVGRIWKDFDEDNPLSS